MEISLIRHGQSQLTDNEKITCLKFREWVEKYNDSGVFEESEYPSETIEKLATAKIVATSDLKRAIKSAKLLNSEIKVIPNPLFRETELPICSMNLLNLKLRPKNWSVLLRILWFCGHSHHCESLKDAKVRALQATQQLMDYATEHKSVVLVGHGFFNMLIAKELRKIGWTGKKKTNTKHWSCTSFTLQ